MLIGRHKETKLLNKVLESNKAEMIAVIGRRRVGKTFLINNIYKDHIIFEQTGVRNASDEKQLKAFAKKIEILAGEKMDKPEDWMDVFFMLRKVLENKVNKEKKVVLFLTNYRGWHPKVQAFWTT